MFGILGFPRKFENGRKFSALQKINIAYFRHKQLADLFVKNVSEGNLEAAQLSWTSIVANGTDY
jgi:hypothetical protein